MCSLNLMVVWFNLNLVSIVDKWRFKFFWFFSDIFIVSLIWIVNIWFLLFSDYKCRWWKCLNLEMFLSFFLIFFVMFWLGMFCKNSFKVELMFWIIFIKINKVKLIVKMGLRIGYFININIIDIIKIVIYLRMFFSKC